MINPNITFTYSLDKDIWCIANKGKSSNNSSQPTKIYQTLQEKYGDTPSTNNIAEFIGSFLSEQSISIEESINRYTDEWSKISADYHERAQKIFNTSLPESVTVYLTINNRCPYNIGENMFFVSFPRESVRKTIMHELWHFYTWYGLGADQEEKLGKQKYNDLKEALTVLLNEECLDLMPEGATDEGYPQHQDLRNRILSLWKEYKNINLVWKKLENEL